MRDVCFYTLILSRYGIIRYIISVNILIITPLYSTADSCFVLFTTEYYRLRLFIYKPYKCAMYFVYSVTYTYFTVTKVHNILICLHVKKIIQLYVKFFISTCVILNTS